MLKITVPIHRRMTLNQIIRTLLNGVGAAFKTKGSIQAKIKQASAIYYGHKKDVQADVARAIEQVYLPDIDPTIPVLIYCVWRPKDRKLDQDNLSTCLKPILDGLVDQEVIPDDSPKYTEPYIIHKYDYSLIGQKNNGNPLQETVDVHVTQTQESIQFLSNAISEFMALDDQLSEY